ncbi:hypothetical protein M9H77_24222 [Catharanthus roseus]|uniref:Uncharacterized protein n=1 Tax=Catharanthus roseus TaxID=4058 RepID=A0ACC0AVI6_CATRO|nr:hypothetical protein M9H77_24222 [Catharanthus roseus]
MPGLVQASHPGCLLVTLCFKTLASSEREREREREREIGKGFCRPLLSRLRPILRVPFPIYPPLTHGASTCVAAAQQPFVCPVTVHLLYLGHLFGLISAVSFYRNGVFLQQVVSEPRFGSSAPASVNNLSDLRSSSDSASELYYYYYFCLTCRRAFTGFAFRLAIAWLEFVRFQKIQAVLKNLGVVNKVFG